MGSSRRLIRDYGLGPTGVLVWLRSAALLAGTLIASLSGAEETARLRFEIPDQFDRTHSHEALRGRIVLLIASDRRGSQYQEAWADALRASVAGRGATEAVYLIEAADLRGVPFFMKGSVKKRFPSEKHQWVLMDWKGVLARTFEFEPDACNVLLFDRSGHLLHQSAGWDVNRQVLNEIGRLLDRQLDSGIEPVGRPD